MPATPANAVRRLMCLARAAMSVGMIPSMIGCIIGWVSAAIRVKALVDMRVPDAVQLFVARIEPRSTSAFTRVSTRYARRNPGAAPPYSTPAPGFRFAQPGLRSCALHGIRDTRHLGRLTPRKRYKESRRAQYRKRLDVDFSRDAANLPSGRSEERRVGKE